jgi:hypothetical protein
MSASLYPLFLNLQGRTCIVIGGNDMAEAKVRDLLNAKAVIRLIAPTLGSSSRHGRARKSCAGNPAPTEVETCKTRSSLCPLPTPRPSLRRWKRGIYSATQWMAFRTATAMHPQWYAVTSCKSRSQQRERARP